ncbi:MAG: methyltransferase domain-containing protein [Ramlibacter sp.]|nr:methyltransferase domain-containing protein [Ramlibacter sp.]
MKGGKPVTFERYYDSEWLERGAYFVHHRRRFVQTWNAVTGLGLGGGLVLDAGGVGPVAACLAQSGWEAHGTDVDLRGPLPFPDHCFHLSLCTEVIEHIKDVDSQDVKDLEAFNYSGVRNMLRELRRTLRPDGLLLVTTPNASSLHMLGKWIHGELLLADPHHVREFTPAELNRVARDCGLRPVWSRTIDSWDQGRSEAVDRVAGLLQGMPSLPAIDRGDNILALFAPA